MAKAQGPPLILAWYVDGTPRPKADDVYRDGAVDRPEYVVVYDERRPGYKWSCECGDFLYHRHKRSACKHITRCQPDVLLFRCTIAWFLNQPIPEGAWS